MTRLNVILTDDLGDWAEARAAKDGYSDPADYVRDVVRHERDYHDKLTRLHEALDEGLASPEVDDTIKDIIADGLKRHAAR